VAADRIARRIVHNPSRGRIVSDPRRLSGGRPGRRVSFRGAPGRLASAARPAARRWKLARPARRWL